MVLGFLLVVVSVLLLYPVVQTWIAGIVSDKLSKDLGITVRIERVEIRPFAMNRLHGVFVADLRGDTLLAVDELRIRGLKLDTKAERITVRRLELHDTRFALARVEGDAHSNLTNILDKMASDDTTKGTADWKIACTELDIRRLHFTYHDGNIDPIPFGVDFDHVDVNTADIIGHDVRVAGDSILVQLEKIALRDHSGLVLDELSGDTKVSPRGISIAGMRMRTPGTDLRGNLRFETNSFGDYDAFETNVLMRVELDSSHLQFADVALFAPDLQGVDFRIGLRGKFRGTVSELKGRDMDIRFADRSRFVGNAEFTGLPDIANTFMVIDVEHFHTDPEDLAKVPVPPFLERGRLQLPVEVQRLGAVSFAGNFTGFANSFTTNGECATEVGAIRTDITYERDTVTDIFQLRGSVATNGFDLGRVINDPTMGVIACDVDVKARGRDFKTMTAELDGTVPELHVAQLNVGGIQVKGRLEKDLFNGELRCDDPNLRMDFDGLADLRGKWPKVDFTANIEHLDPRAFGLIGGKGQASLNMRVSAKGEFAPDSLKGSLVMRDVYFHDDTMHLDIGDMDITSGRMGGEPHLQLRSTIADADITGEFYPTKLPDAVKSVMYSVFPALQEEVHYAQEEQRFRFDLTVKRAQRILDLVVPGLQLDPGTTAKGWFDSRTFDLGLSALVPHIAFGKVSGDSVDVVLDKTLDVLAFRFKSARQAVGAGAYIDGIELTGKAYQDEVQLRAGWEGSTSGTSGDLNLDALVVNNHRFEVDLRPSSLFFGRGQWTNDRTAHFLIDTTSVTVDTLELNNGDQSVRLAGTVSENASLPMAFALENVMLENIEPFYDGPAIHGFVGGDGKAFGLYDHPYLLSYLCVDSLAIEGREVGDLRFAATWNNADKRIDVNGELQRDSLRMLGFNGQVAPGAKEEMDLDLVLDRFDLHFLDAYLPEGISDLQGRLSGTIAVNGTFAEPRVEGTAAMDRVGLRINYLNTFYSFTDTVEVKPDEFALNDVRLMDEEGNIARLNGNVSHRGFKKWSYDVSGTMQHLMVLNTGLAQNSLYYGKAYANGFIGLGGFEDNFDIYVEASTGAGTSLHFPLGASTEVGGIPFVRFVKPGENRDSLEAPIDLTGINLDMKVNVTPDAAFELIFDPTVGDIMSGRGRGDLDMTVTPSGQFSMKGGLEITQGEYLFTLRNLVNKKFTVDPGGTITWFGDPFDAQLNINAVYGLRTALYDIIPPGERTEAHRQRVKVEVGMHLTDKLMNPNIDFQVRLPGVDAGTSTQVATLLSDKDRLNKQVFALVVVNKFLSDDVGASGGFAGDAAASGATTMAEFVSSQLSNLVSSVSDRFDLGFNYRPGNSIASDEVEVAVNTALFNNRVQVNTNFGVAGSNSSGQGGGQFIGDFSLEYLITRDGRLRVKAFSQSNDRNLNQLNQAQTTQGAGVAFREDFNTFGEFFRRVGNMFRRKENERPVE